MECNADIAVIPDINIEYSSAIKEKLIEEKEAN
jgi:hypothetical protein